MSESNVTNSIELLLGKEHADISYLKKDKISNVLSKALSETYRSQPNDPVQFFANFLLNHNKTLEMVYQVILSFAHHNRFLSRTKPMSQRSAI